MRRYSLICKAACRFLRMRYLSAYAETRVRQKHSQNSEDMLTAYGWRAIAGGWELFDNTDVATPNHGGLRILCAVSPTY